MAIEKKFNTEAVNDYPPIRFEIRFDRTEISDCRSLLFDPAKSVPRGKAIWNANGGFVSVLLTHLFLLHLFIFLLILCVLLSRLPSFFDDM